VEECALHTLYCAVHCALIWGWREAPSIRSTHYRQPIYLWADIADTKRNVRARQARIATDFAIMDGLGLAGKETAATTRLC
jgi:hypothetical protein